MVEGTGRCTPPLSRPVPARPCELRPFPGQAGRSRRAAGLDGKLHFAGLEYRHKIGSVADNPAVGDQAVPAGQSGTPHPSGDPSC
jgi:hypothetical protein